jgi:hypothetical protein
MENNENMQSYFDMTDEVAQGTYSNLAVISHSSSEFILDFVRIVPGVRKGNVKSRVIMTPEHAKRLLFALQENIVKYENMFGEIRIPQTIPFPTVQGEA